MGDLRYMLLDVLQYGSATYFGPNGARTQRVCTPALNFLFRVRLHLQWIKE